MSQPVLGEWHERHLSGYHPPIRGGHASVCLRSETSADAAIEHLLVVVGGSDPFGVSTDEVVVIAVPHSVTSGNALWQCTNVSGASVSSVKASGFMRPRAGHTGIVVPTEVVAHHCHDGRAPEGSTESTAGSSSSPQWGPDTLIVFGGAQMLPEPVAFDDVFLIGVTTTTTAGTTACRVVSHRLEASGDTPPPRHAHASCYAVTAQGPAMLVVGGSTLEKPLGDAYVLLLATGIWQSVTLTSGSRSSLLLVPREMSSLVAVGNRSAADGDAGCDPRSVNNTATFLVLGGRSAHGDLLDDVELLVASTTSAAATTAWNVVSVPAHVSGLRPVCCHTVINLSPSTVLCVGGLQENLTSDTLVTVSNETARCTAVSRLQRTSRDELETLSLGFGHSSCSWTPPPRSGEGGAAPRRHFVVSGLVPNASSGPLMVFELVRRGADTKK